jgi:hypothetical protein
MISDLKREAGVFSPEHIIVGTRCERKEGEANVHRHREAVHFVQEQHIVTG